MALARISYADASIRLAILVSWCGEAVRVAAKDCDDLVEFRLIGGIRVSEEGDPVTFEFPLAATSLAAKPQLMTKAGDSRNRVW